METCFELRRQTWPCHASFPTARNQAMDAFRSVRVDQWPSVVDQSTAQRASSNRRLFSWNENHDSLHRWCSLHLHPVHSVPSPVLLRLCFGERNEGFKGHIRHIADAKILWARRSAFVWGPLWCSSYTLCSRRLRMFASAPLARFAVRPARDTC